MGKMREYEFIERLLDGFYWVKQKPAERENRYGGYYRSPGLV